MKRNLLPILGLCSLMCLTACKSKESAYRQAYEQAQQGMNSNSGNTAYVPTTPVVDTVEVKETPVTPVTTVETTPVASVHDAEVRTINGTMEVLPGYSPLKAYSVVVSSFVSQANAEAYAADLKSKGYDARVVKTNETINGNTGWFRVILASFDDKASAVRQRNEFRSQSPNAWLLYRK